MKCKKCKSGIATPIVKTNNANGIQITSSYCPVCGENLDSSKKNLIAVVILFVAIGVALKYFS